MEKFYEAPIDSFCSVRGYSCAPVQGQENSPTPVQPSANFQVNWCDHLASYRIPFRAQKFGNVITECVPTERVYTSIN